MNQLPEVLENLILDYKYGMEKHDAITQYISSQRIDMEIILKRGNQFEELVSKLKNDITQFETTDDEIIYYISHIVSNDISDYNWYNYRYGSGNYEYKKIEDLPIEFVRRFQDKLDWRCVGSGHISEDYNYTKIEDLPIEFVREFQDKISWVDVGDGNFIWKLSAHYVRLHMKYMKYKKENEEIIEETG